MKQRVRDLLHAAPFQPFTIRMSDGKVHKVTNPQCVLAASDFPRILIEDPDGTVHKSQSLVSTLGNGNGMKVTFIFRPHRAANKGPVSGAPPGSSI